MAWTTTDFPALMDRMERIFNETAKRSIAANIGNQVFDVSMTDKEVEHYLSLHGAAGIKEVAQGGDFPKVSLKEGDTINFTQREFGVIIEVTDRMRRFEQQNQLSSLVKSITQESFDLVDQSMADALLYGLITLVHIKSALINSKVQKWITRMKETISFHIERLNEWIPTFDVMGNAIVRATAIT